MGDEFCVYSCSVSFDLITVFIALLSVVVSITRVNSVRDQY